MEEQEITPQPTVPRLTQWAGQRKKFFFKFRWTLLAWLAADMIWGLHGGRTVIAHQTLVLGSVFGLMALSQVGLWYLPDASFEGLAFFYVIFLFDLNVVLAVLWAQGLIESGMVIALFFGVLVGALAKDVGVSALVSVAIGAVFLAYQFKFPGGLFNLDRTENLMLVPVLFITSVHSGLLAQEAVQALQQRKAVEAHLDEMTGKLNLSFDELAKAASRTYSIFDALPFGIVLVDPDEHVQFYNSAAESHCGAPRAQVLNARIQRLGSLGFLKPALDRCLETGHSETHLMKAEGGNRTPVNVVTLQVKGSGGQVLGAMAVLVPSDWQAPKPHGVPPPPEAEG
jgi:PAS domain-containing protein